MRISIDKLRVKNKLTLQWVEVARKAYRADWQKLAQKKYDGG